MKRRDLLVRAARAAPAVVLGGSAASGAYAFGYEPSALTLERVRIPLERLPPELSGTTIALLTDLHVGPYTRPSFIAEAVALANSTKADLVLLGGDYVHRGARYFGPCAEVASGLKARLGVYAVTGNHDHWEGIDEAMDAFAASDITFLRNRAVPLESGGARLWLAGVDDLLVRKADPVAALAAVPRDEVTLLLSHNPDLVEVLEPGLPVDLMLSGHTHGGQVRIPILGPPVVPSRYGQRYAAGIARRGATTVYTSRGIGTISPPVRFNCPPEVTLIELVRA